ncbi:MAG: ornithine carbamoyltransferase [Myxococcota bacterium]|jgi:ornithine carbamoyltransferase
MTVRHLRTLDDLSSDELRHVLALAAKVKSHPENYRTALQGKTLAMIFQKKSTRTRVSFEVGMYQLGGSALFLSSNDIQIGRGEPISDTARVLSRYCDIIMARVYGHDDIEQLAEHATVPVINGLSDATHPCQVLADLQTIEERFGRLAGRHMVYVGDGNNMTHSLMLGCPRVGMDFTAVTPPGYEVDPEYLARARAYAAETGVSVNVSTDPIEGVRGANVIYTDVWASMGQESEQAERVEKFQGYIVDQAMLERAADDCIFMHCLPAHRGEEVSAEVCDGPQSVIFDEAENRLHAQKALMLFLMGAA